MTTSTSSTERLSVWLKARELSLCFPPRNRRDLLKGTDSRDRVTRAMLRARTTPRGTLVYSGLNMVT